MEQLLLGDAAATHIVEYSECIEDAEVNVVDQVDFGLFDKAFLVDKLHECIQQITLNLTFNQRLVHIFHEIRLLTARINGVHECWIS